MSLDMTMTPEPWQAQWQASGYHNVFDADGRIGQFFRLADAEFAAKARGAFAVMMRRGWGVILTAEGWQVIEPRPGAVNGINSMILSSDPVTALLDTDRWYRENIEGKA